MSAIRRLLVWTVLASGSAPAFAQPAPADQALAARERRTTVLTLARGDYLFAELASADALVALRIHGPDGAPVAELTHRSDAPKRTALLAKTTGPHRIDVASLETATAGTYRLDVAHRPATPPDAADVAAWSLFNAAEARLASQAATSTALAIEGYRKAQRAWCAGPCAAATARTQLRIGGARLSLGEAAQALRAYEAARAAADQPAMTGDPRRPGTAYPPPSSCSAGSPWPTRPRRGP